MEPSLKIKIKLNNHHKYHSQPATNTNSSSSSSTNNSIINNYANKQGDSPNSSPAYVTSIPKRRGTQKSLVELIQSCLPQLVKKDPYGLFMNPVDTTVVTDYLKVIKQPMDFSTIKRKLEQYSLFQDFKNDVFLICDNAIKYNAPDTIYHKNAKSLKSFAKKLFLKVPGKNSFTGNKGSRSDHDEAVVDVTSINSSTVPIAYGITSSSNSNGGALKKPSSNTSYSMNDTATSSKRKYTKKAHLVLSDCYYEDGSLALSRTVDLINSVLPQYPFPFTPTYNQYPLPHQNYPTCPIPTGYNDYGPWSTKLEPKPIPESITRQEATEATNVYGSMTGYAYAESITEFVKEIKSDILERYVSSKLNQLTKGQHQKISR